MQHTALAHTRHAYMNARASVCTYACAQAPVTRVKCTTATSHPKIREGCGTALARRQTHAFMHGQASVCTYACAQALMTRVECQTATMHTSSRTRCNTTHTRTYARVYMHTRASLRSHACAQAPVTCMKCQTATWHTTSRRDVVQYSRGDTRMPACTRKHPYAHTHVRKPI
jgi:hypothetical protein